MAETVQEQTEPATELYEPRVGEVAKDATNDRIGEVMGRAGGRYQFRPVRGGREWDVLPRNVRKAPADEVLKAKLAVTNDRSSGPQCAP